MGVLTLGTASTTDDTSDEQTALTAGERRCYYISGQFSDPKESVEFLYKDINGNYKDTINDIAGNIAVLSGRKKMLTLNGPCPAFVIHKTATTNSIAVSVSL